MKFLSNLYDWFVTASHSDAPMKYWLAGLVIVLLLAFLWSTVVEKILDRGIGAVNAVTE